MSPLTRLLLALVVILVDWIVFFVPLGSLFIAYVLVTNPPWVRAFLNGLDAAPPEDPSTPAEGGAPP